MKKPSHEPSPGPLLDRRSVFALAAGSLATTVAPGAPRPATRSAQLDPARPEDAWQILRKLQLRTDAGLVFWWIRGPSFGQIGADLTPLYEMNYGLVQRVTPRADGGCDVRQIEMAFRTDLETGQPLKTLRNPYTGESLPIRFDPVGPSDVHFSREHVPVVPEDLGGSKLKFEPVPSRPFVIGDTVYYRLRNRSVVSTPGAADRVINDISMLTGPATQALDPHTTWVDAKLQSTDVTGWPRWMRMGDRPGGVTLRAVGGKLRRFADMPPDFLKMLQDARPDIAADPVAALDGPEATYRN